MDSPSQIGECIAGRYTVERVLGRGGMGLVYQVRDQRDGRAYALKRGWASDSRKTHRRAALLEREYHTLAQLAHPRIIEVYEYGVDDLGPYYTMELLEGSDLDDRGRVAWQVACALLHDAASSLAILHARGLIHRDVSLRNLRCTNEGRAKLIDFGAMMPMGVAKETVGTPPFVAPEVLQMQELDARSDLFALGAVGYHLLTGRHAYPARRLSDLRDVWRSRPAAPSRIVADVPAALSGLIMQLVALDRGARPKSAADVMERLSAIAGLPFEERVEVSRAYFTTPALVGRDKALVRARREILALVRRDGGTVLIEGPDGSGRSRMLDVCVLEGKLLGVSVLRADASDAANGDWGVARSLCAQLLALMPDEAAEASRLSRDVLSHVVDALRGDVGTSSIEPERSLLLRELRDFVLGLSRAQRLLIAVDDVDQIDEPSMAFLAALANKSERNAVMLVLSATEGQGLTDSASLRLLRLVGHTISLEPLSLDETQTLIRSIFGDVPNVQLVAGRIYDLAHGNPRATMDLAQHLAERGLARYQAGSWILPSQLEETDLPKTLADALAARLAGLRPAARALVELQAIAGSEPLRTADYAALAGIGDIKSVFAAIDELLAARVLVAEGEGYRFTQRGFSSVVRAAVSDERSRVIHQRMAEQLAQRGGDVLLRADHLLRAGRGREAVELLCSIDLSARMPPVSLLERALEQAERDGFGARTLHQLRAAVLSKASLVLAADSFRRCLPPVLAQLERDSGLARYRELSDKPDPERLHLALAETQARYNATPESERVYTVIDAIRELARISGALCSFSSQLNDIDLLESLPSLRPLSLLSPAVAIVERIVALSKQWMYGRQDVVREQAEAILRDISGPGSGGLDDAQARRTRLGLLYSVGLFEAALGVESTEARAATLDDDREYRVSAWRLRMLMHLNQGNAEEARKCQRRAELLQLQDSQEQYYLGMGVGSEVSAYAEAGDLPGVKSALESLAKLAQHYPGWRPMYAYGQCRYRWLQGDLQGALDVLLPAFEYTLPVRHNAFCWLAGAHVRLLGELGRVEEGVRVARNYLALFERERLIASDNGLWIGVSEVLAAAGKYDEAIQTIERQIEAGIALGRIGLALGALYETRARIALRMGDRAGFDRFAELCANEYMRSRNPAIGARFGRLLDDTRQHEVGPVEPPPEVRELLQLSVTESEYNTVHSRMLECVDDIDRARCALTLLLQSTGSNTGYLYGVRHGRPALIAALPEPPNDPAMPEWVDECLRAGVKSSQVATSDESTSMTHTSGIPRHVDPEGRELEPVYLVTPETLSAQIAAVFVVHVRPGARTLPSRTLLETLASELIEHGDVAGVPIDGGLEAGHDQD